MPSSSSSASILVSVGMAGAALVAGLAFNKRRGKSSANADVANSAER